MFSSAKTRSPMRAPFGPIAVTATDSTCTHTDRKQWYITHGITNELNFFLAMFMIHTCIDMYWGAGLESVTRDLMLPGEGQVEKITVLGGRRRREEEPKKGREENGRGKSGKRQKVATNIRTPVH